MKDVIYINNQSGDVVAEGYPNSMAYFSEKAVWNVLVASRIVAGERDADEILKDVEELIAKMKELEGGNEK